MRHSCVALMLLNRWFLKKFIFSSGTPNRRTWALMALFWFLSLGSFYLCINPPPSALSPATEAMLIIVADFVQGSSVWCLFYRNYDSLALTPVTISVDDQIFNLLAVFPFIYRLTGWSVAATVPGLMSLGIVLMDYWRAIKFINQPFKTDLIFIQEGTGHIVLAVTRSSIGSAMVGELLTAGEFQDVMEVVQTIVLPALLEELHQLQPEPTATITDIEPRNVVYYKHVNEAINERPDIIMLLYEILITPHPPPAG